MIVSQTVRPSAALTSKPSLASINPAVLKEAYAAFLTLLLEAARHNADAAAVTAVLEDCKVTGGRVAAITQMIMDALLKNRLLLSKTSFNYPHITDVSWRLDYYIKDDQLEKVNKAVYVIDLQTEANDGAKKDIQFSCTVDQLQDLVAHLKDASRALQNMGQTG